jgi:hypothetical protein
MKNPVLNDIQEYATRKLKEAYGFCGAAVGDDMSMLNSGDGQGSEIKITINIAHCETGVKGADIISALTERL